MDKLVDKFVYSVFDRIEEASSAVSTLNTAGIPSSAISLYASDKVIDSIEMNRDYIEVEAIETKNKSESLWQRIGNLFDSDDHEFKNGIDLSKYQRELEEGSIVLVVESEYQDTIDAINRDGLKPTYLDIHENRYETAMDPFDEGDTADQIAQDIINQTIHDRPDYPDDMKYNSDKDDLASLHPEDAMVNHENYNAPNTPEENSVVERPSDAKAGGIHIDVPHNKPTRPSNVGEESYYNQGEQANKKFQEQEKNKFEGVSDVKRPVTKTYQKPRYDRYEE